MITFASVTRAVQDGATTYRQIAGKLGVSLEDPDLAAAINWMRWPPHELIAFPDGCCAGSMEHTYDCRMVLT